MRAVTAALLDPDKYAGQLVPVWDEQLTPTELVATFAKVTSKPAKCVFASVFAALDWRELSATQPEQTLVIAQLSQVWQASLPVTAISADDFMPSAAKLGACESCAVQSLRSGCGSTMCNPIGCCTGGGC